MSGQPVEPTIGAWTYNCFKNINPILGNYLREQHNFSDWGSYGFGSQIEKCDKYITMVYEIIDRITKAINSIEIKLKDDQISNWLEIRDVYYKILQEFDNNPTKNKPYLIQFLKTQFNSDEFLKKVVRDKFIPLLMRVIDGCSNCLQNSLGGARVEPSTLLPMVMMARFLKEKVLSDGDIKDFISEKPYVKNLAYSINEMNKNKPTELVGYYEWYKRGLELTDLLEFIGSITEQPATQSGYRWDSSYSNQYSSQRRNSYYQSSDSTNSTNTKNNPAIPDDQGTKQQIETKWSTFDSNGKKAFLVDEFDKYLVENSINLTEQETQKIKDQINKFIFKINKLARNEIYGCLEQHKGNNTTANKFFVHLKGKYSLDKD